MLVSNCFQLMCMKGGSLMKKFQIVGRKYDLVNLEYCSWDTSHEFPMGKFVCEEVFPIMEFESLAYAEYWLLDNYPEYYMGGNIWEVESNNGYPDFACFAVPCVEWGSSTDEWISNLFKTRDRLKIKLHID